MCTLQIFSKLVDVINSWNTCPLFKIVIKHEQLMNENTNLISDLIIFKFESNLNNLKLL